MAAPVLQFKRGTFANLPGLRAGEPGFTTDKYDLYVGLTSSILTNQFFGSGRYWGREDGTTSLRLKLVDKNGSNSISLKAPDTLSGVGTFVFPDTTDGIVGDSLRIASKSGDTYTLEWAPAAPSGAIEGISVYDEATNNIVGGGVGSITSLIFAGAGITAAGTGSTATITVYDASSTQKGAASFSSDHFTVTSGNVTFTPSAVTTFTNTTDNTLGNTNTGAVQIDGGLGVDKNVSIGAGLSVTGQSYFIGTATFYGGSITLGDNVTDSISIGGRFASNLVPTTDNAYDVGISTLNWRNAYFSGIGTFETGAVVDGVQIGITGANVIDTVSGNLTLNSAGGTTIIDDAVTIQNNLTVNGNVTVGGTTITLRGQDVYIENKDIILGYTTSITPNDDTANHAGVAIASTVGTPLVSFDASGINTLPATYKQLMWFKSGTLGFTTDAFAFNYGLAIGTTSMANGVRLAVGSGITMSDNTINATTINATTANITNLSGNLTGTISTASRATTIDVTENDASTGSILFAVGTGATSVLRDNDLTFNAITNTLTTQNGVFTGNVGIGTTNPQTKLQVNGTISFPIYDNSSAPGGWNPTLLVGSNILIGDSTTGSKLTPTSTVYGFNNTFIGVGAGSSATTSYVNNFVGKYSGRYTTTGSGNNFFGNNSGYNNVTGFSNNFFGSQSGYENTSGVYNSFYGRASGYCNTTASSNSFFGGGSGFYNTIGSYNSFFGNHAGLYNQTGSYNLFLGSYSGISTSASNKILIGVGKSWSATGVFDAPDTTKSTQFAVGVRTDANPSKYWLVGNENFNVGIGTTNPTSKLHVGGDVRVTGVVTATSFSGDLTGTATNANNINISAITSSDTTTSLVLVANQAIGNQSPFIDSGLQYNANTDTLTLTGDIDVNGGDVNTTSATATVFNSNATTVNAFGAATAVSIGAATGITTVRNKLIVGGNLEIDGNIIQASDGLTNITLTSNTLTTFAGDVQVNGNDIRSGAGSTAITLSNTDVTVAGNLQVTGGIVSTTAATASIFNTSSTTSVNAFGSATAISIGATTGITTVRNQLSVNGNVVLGDAAGDTITVNGTATFGPSITGTISTATRATTIDVTENDTSTGSILFAVGTGATSILRDDQLTFNASTNALTIGSGVGITQFTSSVSTAVTTSSVPTSSAVIDYVGTQIGNIDLTLGLNADTGGPSTVSTSQTLTINGTANEVETSVSGQTVTVGLPNAVVVGTSLSAPTVKTATIQHSNGTQAATIDTSGNIVASQNLTVTGDLIVNGSTTQVNTNTLTVEDRTIELGRVIAGQPTSTTWDLAVLFNYGDGAAKKAGVVWEASGATKRFQFTTDVNPGSDGGPSDTNLPAFAVSSFAPIEISSLWINGCGTLGALEVIKCNTTEVILQDITIDAGSF
jgi:hypothetical protein